MIARCLWHALDISGQERQVYGYYKGLYYGRSYFWLLGDINFPFCTWDTPEFYTLTFIQRHSEYWKLHGKKRFTSDTCSHIITGDRDCQEWAVNVAFLQSHKQDLSWLDSTDKNHKNCGSWLCILKIFLEYSDWDGLRKELWRQLSSSFSDNTQVSWKTHSVDHYFYLLPQSCGLVEEKVHIQQLFPFLLFFPFLVFVFNLRGVNTGYLTYRCYFHH